MRKKGTLINKGFLGNLDHCATVDGATFVPLMTPEARYFLGYQVHRAMRDSTAARLLCSHILATELQARKQA